MKFTEEKLERAFTELLGQDMKALEISYILFNLKPKSHPCILFVNKFKIVPKVLIFSNFLFNSNSEIGFNLVNMPIK